MSGVHISHAATLIEHFDCFFLCLITFPAANLNSEHIRVPAGVNVLVFIMIFKSVNVCVCVCGL